MAEIAFNFRIFMEETKNSLFKPADYFTSMPREGGIIEPVIKALIYAAAASVIIFLWGVILPSRSSGAFGGVLVGSIGITGVLLYIIYSMFGLFIGGAIVLVLSSICGGNSNYETNIRVTASLMVLSPVYALVGFLSWASQWLGGVAGLVVFLYGFWMLYNALVKGLGAKDGAAKILTIALAVIPTLVILSELICSKMVPDKSKDIRINTPPAFEEELLKNVPAGDQDEAKQALDQLKQMNIDDMGKKDRGNVPDEETGDR